VSNEIKARLPFGPEDPWYNFVKVYEALPFRAATAGKYKEIKAHSELIRAGLLISSTFTDADEVGRISFPTIDADLIGNELRATLADWGWEWLKRGTNQTVLRKTLPLENGASTMAMAFLNVLPTLGVDPRQDWLV
jgi:hypothetical protein